MEKKKPLYQIIVDDLRRMIQEGQLSDEVAFPTQGELAQRYNTSEITSRRALSELVEEGLIVRVKGRGTFLKTVADVHKYADGEIKKIYFAYHNAILQHFTHRFYMDLLAGLHEKCEEIGVEFLMWGMDDQFALPEEENIGIVVLPILRSGYEISPDIVRNWKDSGKELVTVHFYYPHLQIPYVIVDNRSGGYLATEHLLSMGHQRIGIILTGKSQLEMNQEFSLRLQGYKLALAQHKIEFDPDLVCVIEGERELEETGYHGFHQLIDLPNPPTAVFATSDYKAIGVIQAAKDRELAVPGDISVVGYDDIMVSQFLCPRLTTVNQNSRKVGRRAVELLAYEKNKENRKDEILPQLIVRATSGEAVDKENQATI